MLCIKPHNSHFNYFILIHNIEKQYQVAHTTSSKKKKVAHTKAL